MLASIALHLWQSTLCLVAAWALTKICRRNAAAVRYWIWFGASVKFLVPFALLQQLGNYAGRSLPAPLPLAAVVMETGNAIFVPSVAALIASDHSLLSQAQTAIAAILMSVTAALLLRWLLRNSGLLLNLMLSLLLGKHIAGRPGALVSLRLELI